MLGETAPFAVQGERERDEETMRAYKAEHTYETADKTREVPRSLRIFKEHAMEGSVTDKGPTENAICAPSAIS